MFSLVKNLLTGLFLALLTAGAAYAQQEVQVNLFTNSKPESAIGFLISSKRNITKEKLAFKQVSEGAYVVTVPIAKTELDNDTVVSAMAILPGGTFVFSDVKLAFVPSLRDSYLTIPACPVETKQRGGIRADVFYDEALLQNLVDVRQAQRELVSLRLEQALSGAMLEKLRKLEAVFGFSYPEQLSAKVPPFELLTRLSNLRSAISNYERTR